MNIRFGRQWRRLLACVGFLVCIPTAVALSADGQTARRFVGRSVVDVLRQLQAEGQRIVFSSTLVPPDLRVTREPQGNEPRAIVLEILAPHGLTLKDAPGNTWLVVRAPPPPTSPPTRREGGGAARPRDEQATEAGAEQEAIRIEEKIDVTDRLGDVANHPSIYRIDPAKALDTPGSLENLLLVLPALTGAAAPNDEEGKLAVRGGGPEHNVIVFDGVQIHSPQRAGDFSTSFINPAVTAGVAFDASGLDAGYGGRLSSVTVLEGRTGNRNRRLGLSGSLGLTSGDAVAEGRLPGTQSGSWLAAVRGTYYKFVADRFDEGKLPGFADVQVKIHLRPTARTDLSLLGLVGRESMKKRTVIPGAPILGQPPGSPQEEPSEIIREDIDGNNRLAAFNFRWTPGARITTLTTATVYSSASKYHDDTARTLFEPFDRDVRVADLLVRQRTSLAWSQYLLDFGVEARRLTTSWAMTGSAFSPHVRPVGPDTWGGLIEYNGPIDSRLNKTLVGVWLQDRIVLRQGLAIEPGVRVDWNSFTSESALQPRFRLTKTIRRAVVWTGLAWQAQTPGHETMQQGYSFYDLTGPEASRLKNERSRQIVVGIGREGGGMTVRIEAYRRVFDRLLVQDLETDTEREERLSLYALPPDMPIDSAIMEYRATVRPESTGTGRATGIEFLLQRSTGRVTGWLGYTLSKAERELYGRTVPFEFDRRHSVALALNVQVSPKVRLSALSQYATGFALTPLHPEPVFPQENQIRPVPIPPFKPLRGGDGALILMSDRNKPLRLSLLNSVRAPAYARTDVRATFALASWIEVYGEVVNLFGRENFKPITAFGDREAQYEIAPGLPRLPTYGLRLKF